MTLMGIKTLVSNDSNSIIAYCLKTKLTSLFLEVKNGWSPNKFYKMVLNFWTK